MHVLIIEEVDLIAEMIRDALSRIGYESFDIAEDEDQAVLLASLRCPDLISTDSKLRYGTGLAAIRRICADRFIPIIFVTVETDPIRAAYADAVIVEKPFIAAELRAAVTTAIARCAQLKSTHG